MEATLNKLTADECQLMAEVLISQGYELEIISSELNDMENGIKQMNTNKYKSLLTLYDKLRIK